MSESTTVNSPVNVNGIVGKDLLSIIERIERIEEERAGLGADIGTILAEAKGKGFDVKIIRMILRMRRREKHELDEEQALLDVYMSAISMAGEIEE
ncbi:MAG: DUF2312 domain-containing protein [Pseudomonadota bacterium]|nr:DUF2312 domain-containing protein [Pseudomonadota bacterium]MDE3037783.1 DUF2312 domain-containing protein [Pseudomonadota bacterium]